MSNILWEKIHTFLEGADVITDLLMILGLIRKSERRGKNVPNEKFFPRFAIDDWHRQTYMRLCSGLTAHERLILDDWILTLEEVQQAHFKVSVANLSWADPTNTTEVTKNEKVAVDFLKEMAALDTHDERCAKADARDYIKDPADEYFSIKLERFLGRRLENFGEVIDWIKRDPNGLREILRIMNREAALTAIAIAGTLPLVNRAGNTIVNALQTKKNGKQRELFKLFR